MLGRRQDPQDPEAGACCGAGQGLWGSQSRWGEETGASPRLAWWLLSPRSGAGRGPWAQSKEWRKKWALESLPKLDPRRGAWVSHFETHGAVVGIKKNVNLTEDTPVTVFLLSESLRD